MRAGLSTCLSFEGLLDGTIDPDYMAQWEQYTYGPNCNAPIMCDHYFVSTHFQEEQFLSNLTPNFALEDPSI